MTRIDQKIGRGQTLRTESTFEREMALPGERRKQIFGDIKKGGAQDISHSITSGKVKRISKGD